jgi:hypothetical protein
MLQQSDDQHSLIAGPGQPLIGIPFEEDGRQFVRYFVGEADASTARSSQTIQAALAVIGAWSDLDWEETAAELDRIRHESTPTPPIEL